ncbi:MAG: type I-U CRISPR-associated helicase/endonuclease Cas3 [Candidatus Sulfotelmatobacter sp.]
MELSRWFASEFQILTGYEPYAWQIALFNNLVLGNIPKNINLPTGSGKTSAIPVWLLAFIKNPTLPRRLVYVVDRRSVVDQATVVVEKIVTRLSSELQSALTSFTLPDEAMLGVSTLRGELADNEEWSKLPFRPAVIVGTVDMVGSRLMFSGYGDSAYDRPRHAGLLGNDTLIVFDECHLVPAFEVLLRNVENAGGKLKCFSVMTMSATSTSSDSLALTEADLANATLNARLNARKALTLVKAPSVITTVISIAMKDPPQRTIIFVQSPRTVVEIASSLKERFPNVIALTGTIRGKERDELVDNPIFKTFTVAQEPSDPRFLVATSAGEVGIDLTSTRMITDMTSAASLVQRFGRCNRFAEAKKAQITVVYKDAEIKKFEREADLNFINTLKGNASCWNLYGKREQLAALTKPRSVIPILEPAVLDVLSMTSLRHDIDISGYLRGKASNTHYVEIAWRSEVPLLIKLSDFDFEQYMKHMRLLSFEKLNETEKQALEVVGTILHNHEDVEVIVVEADATRRVCKLSELGNRSLRDCQLILPPTVGGLTGGMFSAKNTDDAQLDIATQAHKQHEARQRILCPVDDVPAAEKAQKDVFSKEVNGNILIVRKLRDIKRGERVLLTDHSEEVTGFTKDFATRCCLSAEFITALEHAGRLHDMGKANPIWQIAATGKMNNPPLAKISGRFKSPLSLKGFRHEFESLAMADGADGLTKHLVASHHSSARPTWCGSRDLAPVQRDEDEVVDQVNRFAKLQGEYGWWGLAYIEAIFKTADAYASGE